MPSAGRNACYAQVVIKAARKILWSWAGKTRYSHLLVASAKKVIMPMIHAGLYVAFLSWQQNCAAVSRHINMLRRAALRLTKSALVKALSRWHDSFAEKQQDTIMQCVGAKLQYLEIASGCCNHQLGAVHVPKVSIPSCCISDSQDAQSASHQTCMGWHKSFQLVNQATQGRCNETSRRAAFAT